MAANNEIEHNSVNFQARSSRFFMAAEVLSNFCSCFFIDQMLIKLNLILKLLFPLKNVCALKGCYSAVPNCRPPDGNQFDQKNPAQTALFQPRRLSNSEAEFLSSWISRFAKPDHPIRDAG